MNCDCVLNGRARWRYETARECKSQDSENAAVKKRREKKRQQKAEEKERESESENLMNKFLYLITSRSFAIGMCYGTPAFLAVPQFTQK